ncbi:MAG: TolC family protein [Chitinispirillaceae bacterium]
MIKPNAITVIRGVLTALAISVYPAAAQSGSGADGGELRLSAGQAVEMAMKNNHMLKSLNHQLKSTEYDIKSARTRMLPSVNLQASYSRLGYDEVEQSLPGGDFGSNPLAAELSSMLQMSQPEKNNYSVGIQVQQPIFTGFKTLHALNSAKLSNSLQQMTNEKTEQTIRYATLQVYWGIVNLQKSVRVAGEAVRQLEELASNQKALMEQGMATEHDYLLTDASLAQARMNELKVRQTVDQMKREFAVILGRPVSTQILLTDTSTTHNESSVGDLDFTIDKALRDRPDLCESKLQLQQAEIGTKMARSDWFPTLSASFSYSNSRPDMFQEDDWGDSWTGTLALNFPLLNWGDRHFKTRKAVEQQKALAEMVNQQEASVEKEVIDAFYAVEQARNELEVAQVLATAREKAYNATRAKHEQGVSSTYELLDAHNMFISAQYQSLEAATDLELALLNYEMGGMGAGSSTQGSGGQ